MARATKATKTRESVDNSKAGVQQAEKIAIIGGGIAGLFCAYVLAKQGYKVQLFESSPVFGGRIRSLILHNRLLGDLEEKPADAARTAVKEDAVLANAFDQLSPPGTGWQDNLDFCAEFGPMRIELDVQVLLKSLLTHLGITNAKPDPTAASSPLELTHLQPFPPFSSPASQGDPVYDLKPEEEGRNPLELMKLGLCRAVVDLTFDEKKLSAADKTLCAEFMKKRDLLLADLGKAAATQRPTNPVFDAWANTLRENDYWVIQRFGQVPVLYTELKIDLYTMGFWNLMAGYLSHNALSKVRDLGTFYHLLPQNPNAGEWLTWWLRQISISGQLQGVFGGMQAVTKKLEVEANNIKGTTPTLTPNTEVTALKLESNEARIAVTAIRKEEPDALPHSVGTFDRVILALPKVPAQKLIGNSSLWEKPSGGGDLAEREHFANLLDSVIAFPLVKVFFVVRERWWEQKVRANFQATRYPTREVYFWSGLQKDSRRGLVMLYTDRPASSFWANYVPKGEQLDVDELWRAISDEDHEAVRILRARLKSRFVQYVNEAEGLEIKPDDIIWCGIMDWGREPYGGASHAWRPERDYWNVLAELGDMKLGSKSRGPHLHVCGEAYSDYHAFIEGALRSAVYALAQISSATGTRAKLQDVMTQVSKLEVAATRLSDEEKSKLDRDGQYIEDLAEWIDKLNELRPKDPSD